MCVFRGSSPKPVSKIATALPSPVLGGMAQQVVKPAPRPTAAVKAANRTPKAVHVDKRPVAKPTPKPAPAPAPKAPTPVAKTPAPTPTPTPKAVTPTPKKKPKRFVKSGGMIGGSRGSLQIPTGSCGS